MATFKVSQEDLFLLEHWQEDSSLSTDAQREEIFAKYVALGPYRMQQEGLRKQSVRELPPHSQDLLDRIRLPTERNLKGDTCWLRTYYDPSSEVSWAQIQNYIDSMIVIPPKVYNDSSLYNFGSNWEKIFLRAPQLLDSDDLFEEYEEYIQEALEGRIERESGDAQRAEEDGYDPVEDENPWICFFAQYLFRLVRGRIYIVDETSFATEGPDAGTVLVVWYDECGREIRYYREEAMQAAEMANVDLCYINEHACWTNAEIGESYEWGAPLGPPYSMVDQ
ncbi:hypothetical protein N7466_007206 [Penicillium verhagenii]|uniref:uncharacterized protein n=1 Tax=Penicillium verhagenii TaxID=1562060 RepID=UPI0025453FFF|nr:uncharacterized protein N7466_007206 [Penicillium verhagenii]KAJ5928250.1 hypothetical protein N7466_007206 [Penicillium verhagenii]